MEREREIDTVAPESQRQTVPSLLPFTGSVGAYLIVNEAARERRAAARQALSPSIFKRS